MNGTFTCFLILIFSLSIFSCGRGKQKADVKPVPEIQNIPLACIKRVIATDDSLGNVRNHACEKISLSETIQRYVRDMKEIDYANCPLVFTSAFSRHHQAWANMIPITDKYPGLRGEMHDLFKELNQSADSVDFKKREKVIWDTWAEVEAAMK